MEYAALLKFPLKFIAILALAGCAQQWQWQPSADATLSLKRAEAKCKFEAQKSAPTQDWRQSSFSIAAQQIDIFEACMAAEGFEKVYIKPEGQ